MKNKLESDPNFYSLFYKEPDLSKFNFDDYEFIIGDTEYEWDVLTKPLPDWAIDVGAKEGWMLTKNGDYDKTKYGLTPQDIINIIKKNLKKPIKVNKINLDSKHNFVFYDVDTNNEITKKSIWLTVGDLYNYLYFKFNSTKETTEYLTKFGVDGVTHNIDTSDYDSINYVKPNITVIYNIKKFKMVNKETI